MNKTKTSNPIRLIAFFLTAVLLVCTFGFTVDGWQTNDGAKDKIPTVDTDIPTNPGQSFPDEDNALLPEEPEIYIPEFVNRLTGMEATEQIASVRHMAFVMNGNEAVYGVSEADMLVEIPIEDGQTRLISFHSDISNLWKIGSIESSRGYISNIIGYFGGIGLSDGYDDSLDYLKLDISANELEINERKGFGYTEYSDLLYTNCDLTAAGLKASGINQNIDQEGALPFLFNDFGNNPIVYESKAAQVEINDSVNSSLKMIFNEEGGCYSYYKNGEQIVDCLNNKTLDFKNCFILFADSVTYDNSKYSQMLMDTIGSGNGFYITEGSFTEIKWSATSASVMTFYTEEGEKLTINRGSSYIRFVKSSKQNNITFSV